MIDINRNQGQNDVDLKNLSSMSFDEYENKGEPISELVFQHDKDSVTYKEAYYAIKNVISELQTVNQFSLNYVIDIIGLLVGILIDNKILSKDDSEYFTKACIKLYQETINDSKK